ncbi:MAG: hypothetical protein WD851_01290 [Pirellulales bacterium]
MIDRNRKKQLRIARPGRLTPCGLRIEKPLPNPKSKIRNPKSARRGVLLLVVLSMLVLFMLVGTAFLMTSSQYRQNAKNAGRLNQFENQPADLLERALKQVLRDTQNASSVVRYHSLLRDMYGADGFVMPPTSNGLPSQVVAEFSGADASNLPASGLGVTRGQLIDLFVSGGAVSTLKLEPNALGVTENHVLPQTNDYYNGALLTFMSGTAAGQSVRVLDYAFTQSDPTDPTTALWRFCIMACARADGSPLELAPIVSTVPNDLTGVSFMVNGRPFNGTGVGYNPLAAVGSHRLSAYEVVQLANNQWIGTEFALSPNAVYAFPANATYLDPTIAISTDPMVVEPNNAFKALNSAAAVSYPNFSGVGDTDESYDAADFQNMYLALLSVTPRARGHIVDSTGMPFEIDDPAAQQLLADFTMYRPVIDDVPLPSFHRPDLAYFWFQRLFNAPWLTGAISDPEDRTAAILNPYQANGNPSPGLNPQQAAQITAIKRKFILRPLSEDHPSFDGSNPASRPQIARRGSGTIGSPPWHVIGPWDVDNDNDGINDSIWVDLGDPVQETADGRLVKPLYAFLIIDQDGKLNLNAHGTSEHLVNAPLDNVFAATNGSAGNLAGGANNPNVSSNNLAQGTGWGTAEISLRPIFPHPVDNTGAPLVIANPNLLPVFDDYARLLYGRPAQPAGPNMPAISRVTFGRHGGYELMQPNAAMGLVGGVGDVQPGKSFKPPLDPTDNLELAQRLQTRDPHTNFDFVGYPVFDATWVNRVFVDNWPGFGGAAQSNLRQALIASGAWNAALQKATPSSFGTAPDLRGRTSLGIDYIGQPVYESTWERSLSSWGKGILPLWPLVDDSPYELDLSEAFRNDTVADSVAMQASNSAGTPQNDDAPFAVAELERIVRAFDADAGALPDRLWNLVDAFDPVKLAATPRYLVNFPSDPMVRHFQANAEASINRRLVTTESWDMPAPAAGLPNYVSDLGIDGEPGRAGVNDDNDPAGLVDDAAEIGFPGSDDLAAITGRSRAAATIVDTLHYKIWNDSRRRLTVLNNWSEPLTVAQLTQVHQVAQFLMQGELFVDVNGNGRFDAGETFTDANGNNRYDDALPAQLLPPDILAGLKMDLNRPFGDGRDNNGNGVVDEPLEAGEPFVDLIANTLNGRWDAGEPFVDLNGNGRYDGPQDFLWHNDVNANGIVEAGEFAAAVDYLRNAPRVLIDANADGDFVDPQDGVVVPASDYARQLYARHLYVLARLTMDENYVAPYDEDNPQLRAWLDEIKKDLETDPAVTAEATLNGVSPKVIADLVARKKLTYRDVAQWAANSAEMRDPDVIMTPFEYDENPWDGWNVVHYNSSNPPIVLPIDGDSATDECYGHYTDWASTGPGRAYVKLADADLPTVSEQTRGLVWGVERPELLITETLALHDRRTEDLQSASAIGHNELGKQPTKDLWKDDDLDQRLRPEGSLFVEVYNPWSGDGQKPAELYSLHSRDAMGNPVLPAIPSFGVELGRVSDFTDNGQIDGRRSPVWRLIVVEEHPEYRNEDTLDDERGDAEADPQIPVASNTNGFRYTDPDFAWGKWSFKYYDYSKMPVGGLRDTVHNGKYVFQPPKTADWQYTRHRFTLPYPYVEREFYLTSNYSRPLSKADSRFTRTSSRYNASQTDNDFRLRIPDRRIELRLVGGSGRNANAIAQTQKFVHHDAERSGNPADPADANARWHIAPVVPGSYGVIGSAGTRYTGSYTTELQETFTTTVGRLRIEDEQMPPGNSGPMQPAKRRRIDLRVGRDRMPALRNRAYNADPLVNPNQVFVERNGGRVGVPRDNELLAGTASEGRFGPAVAIPVDDMNISEPPWEYQAREFEMTEKERGGLGTAGAAAISFNPTLMKGEGSYARGTGRPPTNPDSFDTPFDDAPELVRTGTTFNYRMIHLQRLANPLLPWNPPPLRADGSQDDEHQPNLTVNLYRTIDSSSSDLTAFNGVSEREASQAGTLQVDKNQLRPWVSDSSEITRYVQNIRRKGNGWEGQWVRLRTHERGTTAAMTTLRGPANETFPTRAIWQQEPARIGFTEFNNTPNLFEDFLDIYPWVDPLVPPAPPEPDPRDRMDFRRTMAGRELRAAGYDDEGYTMQVDMVLEHSLGFGNEAIGNLFSWDPNPPQFTAPTSSAVGGPAIDRTDSDDINDSTYPWLAWNNRPYASGMELLQVPSRSSSAILRTYTVTNPNGSADPYNGGIQPPPATPTPAQINDFRDENHRGHFGHLMNFFQTLATPAGFNGVDPTDPNNPQYIYVGAPNFYRVLDYLYVPSKFVGTDTLLDPGVFNRAGDPTRPVPVPPVLSPLDPRSSLLAPFNRVSKYREPGRVNLNTVFDARVWDGGIMHRQPLATGPGGYDQSTGHLGPGFVGIAADNRPGLIDTRRGYGGIGGSMWFLDPASPTIFANPFRAGDAGDLVPLVQLQRFGVDVSTKRRGFVTSGTDGQWGAPNVDDDNDGVIDEFDEIDLTNTTDVIDPNPFLSGRNDLPFYDTTRNPGIAYNPMTRGGSMTTTRSNVFAVWVTVGFFEVEPAPSWDDPDAAKQQAVRARFNGNRTLYDRVYPQGYALAQEIGSDTGDIKRHRAFYIIDRTLPVGFKPGEDVNVENIIKLRRRIE